MEQSGYPLDIAVSSDGTKLVVSYVALDGTSVKNSVGFYNFSKVGQNSVDRLVGGTEFGDTIVPKVEFVNNNVVCAYGDDKLVIYNNTQKNNMYDVLKIDEELPAEEILDKFFEKYKLNETKYEVKDVYAVEPDDLKPLLSVEDKTVLTLITCETTASTRLVVVCEKIDKSQVEESKVENTVE